MGMRVGTHFRFVDRDGRLDGVLGITGAAISGGGGAISSGSGLQFATDGTSSNIGTTIVGLGLDWSWKLQLEPSQVIGLLCSGSSYSLNFSIQGKLRR